MSYDPPGFGGGGTPDLIVGRMARAGNSTGFGPNVSYAVLVQTAADITINRIGCYISAQAGNIDLGVYDDDGTSGNPGTRLVSTGSIACPATGFHESTVSATTVFAGKFWIALAMTSSSAGFSYGNRTDLVDALNAAFILAADTTRSQAAYPLPATGSFGAGSAFHQNLWVRYV